MSYVALNHVSTGEVATAALHNQLLDNLAILKMGIADDGSLKDYTETQQTVSISAGVLTINPQNGNHVVVALNADITSIVVNNVPSANHVLGLMLYFTADGTQRTITWTVNGVTVKFPGNATPTMTATNGKKDRILLMTRDGGTEWTGDILAQNY